MDKTTQLRTELIDCFEQLQQAHSQLTAALGQESSYPLWIHDIESSALAREKVIQLITAIEYEDAMEPGSTEVVCGIVGTGADTLELVERVNETRARLQRILDAMDKIQVDSIDPRTAKTTKITLTKHALAALGLKRLNRRQACRKFQILNHGLRSASFIWARLRKIERLTRQQVWDLLAAIGADPHDGSPLSEDYAHMRLCQDAALAKVQPAHVHPRANLCWLDTDQQTCRTQRIAVAPLFYRSRPGAKLPRIRPLPDQSQPSLRLRRSDVKINDHRFLQTIPIHRYL